MPSVEFNAFNSVLNNICAEKGAQDIDKCKKETINLFKNNGYADPKKMDAKLLMDRDISCLKQAQIRDIEHGIVDRPDDVFTKECLSNQNDTGSVFKLLY